MFVKGKTIVLLLRLAGILEMYGKALMQKL